MGKAEGDGGVLATGLCKSSQRQSALIRQCLRNPSELMRFVLLILWQPGRCNIGAIGFQDQGLKRQLPKQALESSGSREGRGATESQLEPQVDKPRRLNVAAIEGVCNASSNAISTQSCRHLVLGGTNMQDHWLVEFTGQLELSVKK